MAKNISADLTPAEMAAFKANFDQEMGSVFDRTDRFWTNYLNGEVFEAQTWEAEDYRKMFRKDGTARAVQRAITGPIAAASWTLKAAKADAGEAEWANDWFNRPASQGGMETPMSTLIPQLLSARTYKRAYFEKVYTINDEGDTVYAKIAFRPPGTCSPRRDETTGALRGFKQWPVRQGGKFLTGDLNGVDIDLEYAVIHFNGKDVDPINGSSDMEIVYWCHQQKLKLIFLWFMFCETAARPRTALTGSQGSNVHANARKLGQMKGGGTVGLEGENLDIKVIESSQNAGQVFSDAITYLDRTMTESVLAGFLNLTGAASRGTMGSQALSKDQSGFFLDQMNRAATELQDTITNQIIAPLVYLKFGPKAAVPTFEFGTIGDADIDRIIQLINGLAQGQNQIYPFAVLDQLMQKAAVYLDIDPAVLADAMKVAGDQAEQSAAIALEQKQVALKTAKNPPVPVVAPAGPGGRPMPPAAAIKASGKIDALKAAVTAKGKTASVKPAAATPAKPAAK